MNERNGRDETKGQWNTIRGDEGAPWQAAQGETFGDLPTLRDEGVVLAGRYKVLKRLGEGGMGSVWLAEDAKLDNRKVAIKMLPAILAGKKGAYRQVKAEAMMAMKLSHPNIATVRSFEEDEGGNPFLVMDYVEGEPLDDILAERGPLGEEETVRILGPVAAALDYAHSQGVVHRDVKPGNVMVRKDGVPFVLDFGIAREIQETMTMVTGKMSSGTLLYMSPEQLHGKAPKAAQDVYSFATMVYECLSGRPPFSRGQIEWQIDHDAPEELPDSVGEELKQGVMAGLAKEAGARPETCAGVLGRASGGGFRETSGFQDTGKRRPDSSEAERRSALALQVRLERALSVTDTTEATPEEKLSFQKAQEAYASGEELFRRGLFQEAANLFAEGEEAMEEGRKAMAERQAKTLERLQRRREREEDYKRKQEEKRAERERIQREREEQRKALLGERDRQYREELKKKRIAAAVERKARTGRIVGTMKRLVLTAACISVFVWGAWWQTEQVTSVGRRREGKIRILHLPGGETMKMVWCRPGTFTMGSPETETGRYDNEIQHEVTMEKGFWMSQTEVTQRQWKSVMGSHDNPSWFIGDDRPVDRVTWKDCQAFCAKAKSGLRLPTEAEWEYACRAGTRTALPNGEIRIYKLCDSPTLEEIAWYAGNSSVEFRGVNGVDTSDWIGKRHPGGLAGTHDVHQKEPNAWGLFDMLGNVREWCGDYYGDSHGDGGKDESGAEKTERVIRGGSWADPARNCRSAFRLGDQPDQRGNMLGFRVCCQEIDP